MNTWDVARCENCGVLFLNPRLDYAKWSEYVRKANFYLSNDKDIDNEIKRIKKYEPGRILDVGCGSGKFLQKAGDIGWEVTGVEVFPGNNPYNLPIKYGVFEDVALPENSFDLITLWGVTEYIYNPITFFKKINSLLKENGKLFFVCGNYYSVQRAVMKVNNFPIQQFVWSKKSIKYVLNKVGLEISGCDYRNDIRNGWCTEYITFLFKHLILRKSYNQILHEHNSGKKERNPILLAVKLLDRILTIPISILSEFVGLNGVMNIEAKRK